MASFTTQRTGNWSDASATGPWYVAGTGLPAGGGGAGGVPGNGDTVTHATGTLTVDGSQSVGTSPAGGGTVALTINSTLIVSGTLKLRGPVTQGNAAVTLGAGSILEFDASQAATPLAQKYAWTSNGFSRGNRVITCNGTVNAGDGANFSTPTTGGTHVTIRSNASGGNGYFTATSGYNDSMWFAATYADFQRIGDSVNDAITFNVQSNTTNANTLYFCTFDANSGRLSFLINAPVAAAPAWDFQDCYFNQSAAKVLSGFPSPLVLNAATSVDSTALRKVYRCRFAQSPVLVGGAGCDYQDNYYYLGWQCGAQQYKWLQQYGCLIRGDGTIFPTATTGTTGGDVKTSFLLADAAPVVLASGSAGAGSTGTTLVVSGLTSGAYNPTASSWFVEITSGAGVGQRRMITANTATSITIPYRWDTIPAAGDSYQIVQDIANVHPMGVSGNLGAGVTINLDTVIAQFTGCDSCGDLYSATSHQRTITRNIVLPNGMGDSSFTPFTCGAGVADSVSAEHNTWFMGAQAASISEQSNQAANTVTSLRSNIGWAVPGRAYYNHGGCGGPYLVTNSNSPSTSNTDQVSANMADYNCTYGLLTTGYAATTFSGSPAAQVGPYNYKASVAPGAHDQSGANPGFVDPTRSFWKWAVSQGSASTTMSGQIADGLAYIRANPTLTRTSLIPYIQAGFTPTNPALHNADHTGAGDIGAVAYHAVVNPVRIDFDLGWDGGFSVFAGGYSG